MQGIPLPGGVIVIDVLDHLWLEHEETSINPPLSYPRLLGELGHQVAVESQPTKAGRRPHGGDSGQEAVRPVKGQEIPEVDAGNTVSLGEHEGLISYRGGKPFDPATRLGLHPRIDQVQRPIFARLTYHGQVRLGQTDC